MRVDPYKHKEKFLSWKNRIGGKIPEISNKNSKIILEYIYDMEHGLNVSGTNKKGSRSYNRLNNLRQRMVFMTKLLEKGYNAYDLSKMEERQIHAFFTDMRNGIIKRLDGKTYEDPANFVKIFKAFWHWWQKVNRKRGVEIYDITMDLDTSKEKPKWVYLTEEEILRLCDNALHRYKVLIMFLFDTGIRAPGELINIKVSDFYNDFKELNIRDEISKTFGRRIKLMLCSDLIKRFVNEKNLSEEDYVFPIDYKNANKYLKRLGKRVLGDVKSPAGQKYSQITLYDFRHCSCCYWMPRYKSESALKYRFGWKKSDKIHYYSELLGMRDTITEEDLLMDVTKTEIENRLHKSENEKEVLKERLEILENQMKVMAKAVQEAISNGKEILFVKK
ncbi:MAG: tyrosine-type recombinase/integrase [Nanoarchaeota archaeon]|nr:tyrosine-type recombinase/integrase [Nanoarchaeota archaeon]